MSIAWSEELECVYDGLLVLVSYDGLKSVCFLFLAFFFLKRFFWPFVIVEEGDLRLGSVMEKTSEIWNI